MFSPANKLETILQQAAADHEHAPAFYEELMASTVFVLGKPENIENETSDEHTGEHTAIQEEALILQHWERETDQTQVVPFFSSLNMLRNTLDANEPYLELSTIDFFQITLGAPLVLNPNSDYGMEFEPEDVAILLDTELMTNSQHVLDEQTEVLLGHVSALPDAFIKLLHDYLVKHTEVEAAYLGTIQIPADDDKEHLMVGIQGEGDFHDLMSTLIHKISLFDGEMPYETVDFYVIDQDDADISQFMVENIEPFYTKTTRVIH